jgi:hypothetical protein
MILLLASAVLAQEQEPCYFDHPISIVELREALKTCYLQTGTSIRMQIVELPPNETKPGIGFHSNDSALTAGGKETLDGVATVLALRKKMSIVIVGYADGDLLDLSLRRAEIAADYLVSKGIERSRVTVQAAGAENPVDVTGSAEGRARNRRVEFVVSAAQPAK